MKTIDLSDCRRGGPVGKSLGVGLKPENLAMCLGDGAFDVNPLADVFQHAVDPIGFGTVHDNQSAAREQALMNQCCAPAPWRVAKTRWRPDKGLPLPGTAAKPCRGKMVVKGFEWLYHLRVTRQRRQIMLSACRANHVSGCDSDRPLCRARSRRGDMGNSGK